MAYADAARGAPTVEEHVSIVVVAQRALLHVLLDGVEVFARGNLELRPRVFRDLDNHVHLALHIVDDGVEEEDGRERERCAQKGS